jgi:hypothetical protein
MPYSLMIWVSGMERRCEYHPVQFRLCDRSRATLVATGFKDSRSSRKGKNLTRLLQKITEVNKRKRCSADHHGGLVRCQPLRRGKNYFEVNRPAFIRIHHTAELCMRSVEVTSDRLEHMNQR